MKHHVPVMEKLHTPMPPSICGCVTEPRDTKPRPRICYMVKGHKGPHFDAIPFKPSPEKFYGSAKAYAKAEKKR